MRTKYHSSKKLLIKISSQTFSIGYKGCAPICVYATQQGFEGIETTKLKQIIDNSFRVYSVHAVCYENFGKTHMHTQFLIWYKKYINNITMSKISYRGNISQ